MKKDTLKNYFIMNLRSVVILIYLKALRLYSMNMLELKYYNKNWLISVGSTLFSLTLTQMFGSKITDKILKVYDKENLKARETVATALSIFYILFLKFVYMLIFFNKNILDGKYIQVTIISILSITFYSITIKPFFNNSHASRFLNSLINDTILLLASDFIADAKIDNNLLDVEISTIGTLFRIIINSIITIKFTNSV
tara:strand:+ start:876 stop:1469 length:594 start_codon:yes stop_codon:yes gene_type:complete